MLLPSFRWDNPITNLSIMIALHVLHGMTVKEFTQNLQPRTCIVVLLGDYLFSRWLIESRDQPFHSYSFRGGCKPPTFVCKFSGWDGVSWRFAHPLGALASDWLSLRQELLQVKGFGEVKVEEMLGGCWVREWSPRLNGNKQQRSSCTLKKGRYLQLPVIEIVFSSGWWI